MKNLVESIAEKFKIGFDLLLLLILLILLFLFFMEIKDSLSICSYDSYLLHYYV